MTCKVKGCDRPHDARGFCQPHYDWMRRRGFLRRESAPVASTRGLVKRRSAG